MTDCRNEIKEFCILFLEQKTQKDVKYSLSDNFTIYCDDKNEVLIIEYDYEECIKLLYTVMEDGRRVTGKPNIVGNESFSIMCNDEVLKEIRKIIGNSNLVEY